MKDFYPRQIKSLSKVSQAQAEVKDKDSGDEVGEIPDIKALLTWYGKNCPRGETTIVHGDFKMDNMVRAVWLDCDVEINVAAQIFHPTKPEVIGVLDWELSTLVRYSLHSNGVAELERRDTPSPISPTFCNPSTSLRKLPHPAHTPVYATFPPPSSASLLPKSSFVSIVPKSVALTLFPAGLPPALSLSSACVLVRHLIDLVD